MQRWRRMFGVAVPALGFALAAQANEADVHEPPELIAPPVTVDEIQPAELSEDPSSFTTTIDLDDYAGEATDIESILAESVGVQVRRFGGPGARAELSIRGSSANQVVVLLDGVRLNDAVSGGVDLSTIPRDLIERIEVSRGGGSVWTGSDAIGGVVNLITKRASGAPRTTATFSGGSWDTYQGSLTQTGSLFGVEAIAAYDGFSTDGDWRFQPATRIVGGVPIPPAIGSVERVNNDRMRHSALLRLARDLGTWGRVQLTDSFYNESGGVPGTDDAGGALLGQSLTAERRRRRNLVDLQLQLADVTPLAISGSARVYHRYTRNRFRDPVPRLGAPIDTDQRFHALGTRLELERALALLGTEQRLALGVDLRQDWLDQAVGATPERFVVGVFAQDEIRFAEGAVRIIPALRFDATDGFASEWIPRLGVIVQPWIWLRLQGNIERSYRIPHFDELFLNEEFVRGNPNLRPEDAVNADVGFTMGAERLGPLQDVQLEFAWFHNDIDDSIVFAQINAFVVAANNTGAALAEGYELSGGFSLLEWLRVSANWTRIDTRIRRTGRSLPGRADDEVFVRSEFGPPGGMFRLIASHHYTSSIPVTFAGGSRVAARTVHGVGAVVDLLQLPWLAQRLPGNELLLSVTADNVSDQSVRDAQFFPQPGRSIVFRVEWRR